MSALQGYFETFHNAIKLNDMEENRQLREKRDIILERLSKKLREANRPGYTKFDQGSYSMNTGIVPIDGEYDIDVGIRFDISKDDYTDPVEVKNWVYEALKDHTSNVTMKNPCVRVAYLNNGVIEFHVDLAIYAANNPDGKLYLARGKQNSGEAYRVWEVSDPLGLLDLINNHYSDANDRAQFRRVIRYMKRWKDFNFSSTGNAAPVGIGITVCAYHYFAISKSMDYSTGKMKYNDLVALKNFVQTMLNHFEPVYSYDDEAYFDRLKAELPTEPKNDIFENMTNKQIEEFKTKLDNLLKALNEADTEADPVKACEKLQKVFGDDFPVPTADETAVKVTAPAIVGVSNSALR